ncbi:MAG: phytanoyl-CoA dioxygenase family protein [Pseudomonadota bacterium]
MEALTPDQRLHYEEHGYLVLERRVPMGIIEAIRAEIARFETIAVGMTGSDDRIDLETSHTPEVPRIRRVKRPDTQSQVFADLMRSDHILAPARDLIGPDIRLQTSKLNMKSAGYGAAIEWHQDWAFYPHTNDDVLAIGVVIDDMGEENGPLMIFPGTHKGPVLDHHNNGVFVGGVDLAASGLDVNDAVTLTGPAGSISIHHGRVLHGSALNRSDRSRRLCFFEMMAADAFPIMGAMTNLGSLEEYDQRMLCGASTKEPRVEAVPVRVPLPLPAKAGSIYEVQEGLKARSFERL